jgi:amidase
VKTTEPPKDRRDETSEWYEGGAKFTARDCARAITIVHSIGRRFGAFFANYDVLLSPTLAEPPLPFGSTDMMKNDLASYNERLFRLIPFTPLFNASGGPGISLPLHWSSAGIRFGANFGNEAVLLRLAAQLEQAKPWHDKRPSLYISRSTPKRAPARVRGVAGFRQ